MSKSTDIAKIGKESDITKDLICNNKRIFINIINEINIKKRLRNTKKNLPFSSKKKF